MRQTGEINKLRFATRQLADQRAATWGGSARESASAYKTESAPARPEKQPVYNDLLFVSRELDGVKAMVLADKSVENTPSTQSFTVASALKKVIDQAVITTGMKPTREELQQKLHYEEARIGSLLFGDVPAGRHREFYQHDALTWVWNETQYDQHGQPNTMHVSYLLTPEAIYKSVNDGGPTPIADGELANFSEAVKEHSRRLKAHLSEL